MRYSLYYNVLELFFCMEAYFSTFTIKNATLSEKFNIEKIVYSTYEMTTDDELSNYKYSLAVTRL